MKRWVYRIQKIWYRSLMQIKGRKLNRLIGRGNKLTSGKVLKASRDVDGIWIRFHEVNRYLEMSLHK